VKEFDVELKVKNDVVRLSIRDAGAGFVPDTSIYGPGLGLISMRERIRAIGGSIHISSFRKAGTLIEVQVPMVEPNVDDARAPLNSAQN